MNLIFVLIISGDEESCGQKGKSIIIQEAVSRNNRESF